ncbi:hypothetical protein T12_3970, partial [Trichinella patagoniensis]
MGLMEVTCQIQGLEAAQEFLELVSGCRPLVHHLFLVEQCRHSPACRGSLEDHLGATL